mmetsp:Transcript_62747/g.183524  ORF Transcript_62747/g.183524 Transcript_62747/m.183524 type:complete len:290 (-) Transcript_62747:21-890(-)
MIPILVASFVLSSAVAWGADGAAPGLSPSLSSCLGYAECSAKTDPLSDNEDGSLFQVHRSVPGKKSLMGTATMGQGCPDPFVWGILQGVASTIVELGDEQYMPIKANHTFTNQSWSYPGCSGTVDANATMSINADLQLDKLECNRATCSQRSWFACTEYRPISGTAALTSKSLTVEVFANGVVSWGAGCLNSSISAVSGVTASFIVVNPVVEVTGAINCVVFPPGITSPTLSSISVTYDSIEDIQCTLDGKPFAPCLKAMNFLGTQDFKLGLAEALKDSFDHLKEALNA